MGGGTVLISLPKKWASRNNVTKGSTVVVEELSPRKLIVRPIEGNSKISKEVAIGYPRDNLAYLINEVTGTYLLGYDIIKIQGKSLISREDRERLKSLIRRLVGLEIMDEDSKSMTIQFLPEPSILDPEKIVKRIVNITQGMLKETRDGMLQADQRILTLVSERDDEVDRLYFLLVRTIRTATIDLEVAERYNLTPVECLDYRVLASFLESLGDTIAELAHRALELPGKSIAKAFDPIFRRLEEMEGLAINSFLSRKTSQSKGSYVELESLQSEITELSKEMIQVREVSTKTIDMLSLVGRIAKIFVDISDLSLPLYVFQQTDFNKP
jgi:phosphate uptake regulator